MVPEHYLATAKQHWLNYRTRIQQPLHREARFRDGNSNLPDAAQISTAIKSNVDFLAEMYAMDVWQPAHPSQALPPPPRPQGGPPPLPPGPPNAWTRPPNVGATRGAQRPPPLPGHTSGNTSLALGGEMSTVSTQSLRRASVGTTSHSRVQELRAQMKQKMQALNISNKVATERITTMETQFNRLSLRMDQQLDSVTTQVEKTTTNQVLFAGQLKEAQASSSQKFDELGASLLSSMESQNNLTNNVLAMQSQIEVMSKLLEEVTKRMDAGDNSEGRKRPAQEIPPSPEVHSLVAFTPPKGTLGDVSISTMTPSFASTDDSHSAESPQRKRQKSTTNTPCKELDNNTEMDPPEGSRNCASQYLALEAAQADRESSVTNTPPSTTTEASLPGTHNNTDAPTAPLDPRYKETRPAGAKEP